jgi:hypothetical protein
MSSIDPFDDFVCFPVDGFFAVVSVFYVDVLVLRSCGARNNPS